ncbi:hypothetical protein STRATTON_31 [Erwinia phage vB_EamM_Stratton]|uniref:Uncharacterized protein n=2 Tax=Erskinevirus EaH2 TaxID=2169883 RepID=A0A1B2IGR1_9CAUD|nr:hypothetical protein G173_gp198 [Erwinia phage phiEaH2]AFQ96743.1 hypothetical protein [Erwinia phage phiEaH2]ANZ50456.1 hypothetical protein STRATTON_31 [Erwinia phage vB_EamM_Stratton]
MLYRVRANHLICVDLGVLGYVNDGEWFLQMVINYIRTIPRLHIELGESPNEQSIVTAVEWALLSYTRELRFPGTRSEFHQLNQYLKTLNDEYRRWKFDECMESQVGSVAFDDLRPLLTIVEQCRILGESSWDILRTYANDLMLEVILSAIKEHFAAPMDMFMTVHKEKVKGFDLYVHFPTDATSALDLKLLVDIPEE